MLGKMGVRRSRSENHSMMKGSTIIIALLLQVVGGQRAWVSAQSSHYIQKSVDIDTPYRCESEMNTGPPALIVHHSFLTNYIAPVWLCFFAINCMQDLAGKNSKYMIHRLATYPINEQNRMQDEQQQWQLQGQRGRGGRWFRLSRSPIVLRIVPFMTAGLHWQRRINSIWPWNHNRGVTGSTCSESSVVMSTTDGHRCMRPADRRPRRHRRSR